MEVSPGVLARWEPADKLGCISGVSIRLIHQLYSSLTDLEGCFNFNCRKLSYSNSNCASVSTVNIFIHTWINISYQPERYLS
jgi:hypothetical protein